MTDWRDMKVNNMKDRIKKMILIRDDFDDYIHARLKNKSEEYLKHEEADLLGIVRVYFNWCIDEIAKREFKDEDDNEYFRRKAEEVKKVVR
ncbi:MAG: hypothetical protein ACOC80_13040 [Petrotogales bacterium]